MSIQTLQTIKSWFNRGDKPTEEQFSSVFDSFFHKSETIEQNNVQGLSASLQNLAQSIQQEGLSRLSVDETKVDKIAGKGLSTEDYTTAEKQQLAALDGNTEAIDAIEEKIPSEASSTNKLADKLYVDTAVTNGTTGLATQASVTDVTDKIPSEASSANKLADKNFVNSSIATATATFRGTFTTTTDLPSTGVDNNDYAFVVATDSNGNTVYNRYKYDGTEWTLEYALNNSSFTAAQWAAITSGIVAQDVEKLADIVHDACRVQSGESRQQGYLIASLYIWSVAHRAGYYGSPDTILQMYAPYISINGTAGTYDSTTNTIDLSSAIAGEITSAVSPKMDTSAAYAAFAVATTVQKIARPIVSTSELLAGSFNDLGLLTESKTLTLPSIGSGTAPEFNGQFQIDAGNAYSVTFPTGITMVGDTTYVASGVYQFSICNGYGVVVKVSLL